MNSRRRIGSWLMVPSPKHRAAFTLIELLVVISIIALLVGLLLPALAAARRAAQHTTCGANLHQIAIGITAYSVDRQGEIPVGPGIFDPLFGQPRNQIATTYAWLGAYYGLSPFTYDGLGALMDHYIPEPRILFCPGDDTNDPTEELEHVRARGNSEAFSSYLYRQLDQTQKSRLDDLGNNDAGHEARALALDMNSFGDHPALERTNHEAKMVNILYRDGHVLGTANTHHLFSMDPASANATLGGNFGPSEKRLNQILVNADYAENDDAANAPQLP